RIYRERYRHHLSIRRPQRRLRTRCGRVGERERVRRECRWRIGNAARDAVLTQTCQLAVSILAQQRALLDHRVHRRDHLLVVRVECRIALRDRWTRVSRSEIELRIVVSFVTRAAEARGSDSLIRGSDSDWFGV